ncbi:hypothetical protein [Listeria sp. PSOL-1]|uniref:hypothetical protein n=1 Tax=Listeria sp. PSOL-1 TaxID=1844999 RepID=UPI0013D34068|nr:hypothetical protein [Listeria sp. PSOL-1]
MYKTQQSDNFSNFIIGMGKILDVNYINISKLKKPPQIKSDYESVKSDWEKVGKDIEYGITEYRKKYER